MTWPNDQVAHVGDEVRYAEHDGLKAIDATVCSCPQSTAAARKGGHGLGRELAQLQADLVHPVGRQHAGPAAIGHDGQAPPDRTVARCQALGRRKKRHKRSKSHCV
mgnify:CR=1 FL=1